MFTFFSGGSPYPLLGYKELMRLLKTDYRMEKPDLCTEELYVDGVFIYRYRIFYFRDRTFNSCVLMDQATEGLIHTSVLYIR